MSQLEPRLLARTVDTALHVLETNVRGKKERLVHLLETIRAVRLGKDKVLFELMHQVYTFE